MVLGEGLPHPLDVTDLAHISRSSLIERLLYARAGIILFIGRVLLTRKPVSCLLAQFHPDRGRWLAPAVVWLLI